MSRGRQILPCKEGMGKKINKVREKEEERDVPLVNPTEAGKPCPKLRKGRLPQLPGSCLSGFCLSLQTPPPAPAAGCRRPEPILDVARISQRPEVIGTGRCYL